MAFRSEYCLLDFFSSQPFAFPLQSWTHADVFDYVFIAIVLALILQLSAQSTGRCTNNMMKSSRVSPFLFLPWKQCETPVFLLLGTSSSWARGRVCLCAALLSCSGVRSLGQCFPLRPLGALEAVLSAWLCVRPSCEVWKINARIAACWADVHAYSGLVVTRCHYQGSQVYTQTRLAGSFLAAVCDKEFSPVSHFSFLLLAAFLSPWGCSLSVVCVQPF